MNETRIRKGTIMKRTTALALVTLACLMAMPSIAQARYRDGMNLYQYVGSSPTSYTDASGLWKIERKGEARATATAVEGDTLSGLAKAVKLDGFEMPRWAKGDIRMVSDGGWRVWMHNLSVPLNKSFLDSKVCRGEKLTVPNTGYIDVSSYTWGVLAHGLMAVKSGVSNVWTRQGLRVVHTNTWNTSKQTILAHLQVDEIYKYLYIGHGAAGCMTSLDGSHVYNKGEYWNGSEGILGADKFTKYGIADLGIIACGSYDSKEQWRKNVSSLGVLRLVKGAIRCWNIKDVIVIVP